MAHKRDTPEPKKVLHRGGWEIYWYWNRKKYSYHPGLGQDQEDAANYTLHIIAVELHKDQPEFPDNMIDAPGISRYLEDRYGAQASGVPQGDWVEAYTPILQGKVGLGWSKHSLRYLNMLREFSGDIAKVTHNQAEEFLAHLLDSGLSAATHNKALAACSRFYKWALRTRRARSNPFADIAQMREIKSGAIIYCTKDERKKIINAAKESGWTDWMAIPIAFYAGLRREEIARLAWPDIRFESGIIFVGRSKTGKSREAPLSSTLESILKTVPEAWRQGYVVQMEHRLNERDTDELRADRLTAFSRHLKKVLKDIHPEISSRLVSWNPFRHTFGSLLAQAGVSIDKISSWMGNTPEVCRRHYAQFIPRDRRDSEIDKL